MALRFLTLAALAATAVAKTDIKDCTYVDSVYTPPGRTDIPPYATRTWYVPDTGEICELLDCGGGRAPPKTDVPGCGNYKGTDTYSPKFMPSSTTAEASEETGDADESEEEDEDEDVSGSEALTTPAPTESGAAPEESGSDEDESGDDEEGSDEGAENGDDSDSGATAMGASLGGLVAVAAALGLF